MTALPVRIAAIGLGHWGKNIVRNLHNLGALAALYDSDPDTLAAFKSEYHNTQAFGSLADIFAAPDLPAVMIATPAATHGKLADQALDAGKHVFVEKPICLDVAEAERLKQKARERGLVLMVGHLLLYHPAFLALKNAVANGVLGRLRYIYSTRASLGKIRQEENALWSFAPHDISMILQIAGSVPRRVSANGGVFLSENVADTTLSYLDFAEGLQAHLFVSWLHPYKEQRLVVVGDRAMAVFDDVQAGGRKLLLYRHQAQWVDGLPVIDKADAEPIPYEQDEPLKRECRAFIAAISGGETPPSDAEEGVRVLTVLNACQHSLDTGYPVDLSAP